MAPAITIRHSTHEDGPAVLRLAQLDDRPAPEGDSLLAFVDGELAVARALRGNTVADPFRRTKEIVEMLDLRAQSGAEGGVSSPLAWEVARSKARQGEGTGSASASRLLTRSNAASARSRWSRSWVAMTLVRRSAPPRCTAG